MDTRTRELIKADFEAGRSWTQMRQGHPAELRDVTFEQVLGVLGFKDFRSYRAQYKKNYSRARYYERSSSGFRSTRLHALERDGNSCVVCQAPSKTVHHIDEFKESQDSDLDNLVTLCAKHHAAAHAKIGPFLKDRSGRRDPDMFRGVQRLNDAMREYAITINGRTGRHLAVRTCRNVLGREVLEIVELPAVRT